MESSSRKTTAITMVAIRGLGSALDPWLGLIVAFSRGVSSRQTGSRQRLFEQGRIDPVTLFYFFFSF